VYGQGIEMPYPYLGRVTAAQHGWRFFQDIAEFPLDRIGFLVRHDAYLESIDHSIVGMNLHSFAQLLSSHYEMHSSTIEKE